MYELLTAVYERNDLEVFGTWASLIMFLAATFNEEIVIGVIVVCVCMGMCMCMCSVSYPCAQKLPRDKHSTLLQLSHPEEEHLGYLYHARQPPCRPV